MVEQEHSLASPVSPMIQNSNAAFSNDSVSHSLVDTTLINAEPLLDTVLLKVVKNNDAVHTLRPKEEKSEIVYPVDSVDDFNLSFASDPRFHEYYSMDLSNIEGWQPLSEVFPPNSDPYFEVNSPLSLWGNMEGRKMDDVFQVDKDDLVQSPTLAELNANNGSLFDSFDSFDVCLPNERKYVTEKFAPSLSDDQCVSPFKMPSSVEYMKFSPENGLCEKTRSSQDDESKDYVPEVESKSCVKDDIHLVPNYASKVIKKRACGDTLDCGKRTRKTSSALDCVDAEKNATPTLPDLSKVPKDETEDEESDADYECSSYDDDESDEDSKIYSYSAVSENILQKKKSRYFWQYNMQAKGPKSSKLKLAGKSTSKPPDASDSVIKSVCLPKNSKQNGKARRGDGNDLTPNPRKLYNIGLELEKLNSVIDSLRPVNELPFSARSKSRKEKNKLASRACRLKKKAQHEANKLKLFGLRQEQGHLVKLLEKVKELIMKQTHNLGKRSQSLYDTVETLIASKNIPKVAGHTADYVNNVLKTVGSGDDTGGLNIFSNAN